MQSLKFNQEMIDQASLWANDLGGIKNSITRGDGNFAGRMGELALAKHLGLEVSDRKDYDMIFDGKKIEVKTKRRSVKPKPDYVVNVAATSEHQRPDIYAFVSLQYADRDSGANYTGLEHIWVCGYKDADQFWEECEFWPKGFPDPKMPSWKSHVDMHVMYIKNLDERL